MAIRYILFDAAGTLIYPEPGVAVAYEAIGREHGCSLSAAEIKPRFAAAYGRQFAQSRDLATDESRERQRWRAVVAEVFHEWPHAVEVLLENLWQHFAAARHWPLFDDVASTWQELTALGYTLGIASNFDGRLRAILAERLELDPPLLFVSTAIGHAKPSASFFAAIQQRLAANADDILMVGDDEENDVLAPRRAGWHALHLQRGQRSPGAISGLDELRRHLPK